MSTQQRSAVPPMRTLSIFEPDFRALLATVTAASTATSAAAEALPHSAPPAVANSDDPESPATSTACGACAIKFAAAAEMRAHFKTDWHRYNLKRKLADKPPVSEDHFDELVDVSSIEASDSEDDEDDEEQAGESGGVHREDGSPFLLLSLPDDRSGLRIYKELVSDGKKRGADELDATGVVARLAPPTAGPPRWALLMLAAGHFAGTIVDCKTGKALAHKTFHRYTTRRKQGGAQSTSDAAKGAAHSAGSTLRRYNEQALKEEIAELLKTWKPLLDSCQLIFIRAAPLNRKALFYDGSPLSSGSDRVRSFPFTTRRPTFGELMRCFKELTTVRVQPMPQVKETPAAVEQKAVAKSQPDAAVLQAKPAVAETPALDAETTKLVNLCKRGKVDLLRTALDAATPDTDPVNLVFPDVHGTTLLHVAATAGQAEMVDFLLTAGADPTKRTEKKSGQRPYDVAADKDTRDAFRRFMARQPDAWDWREARVPGPLTEEMERAQREKEREKKKKAKEKQKEYNAAKKSAAPPIEPEPEVGPPRATAAGAKARKALGVLSKTEREAAGMTPERRAALDREKRALAAEARMRGGMNQCAACGKSLIGISPFEKFMFRYCSMFCVQSHQILHS
ncbi:hypothetical protein BDZ88DRAFT_415590 [Geranomyces variabilis]|nr:hypothetical protein BDZ88DRAFT_415590 [Geranomyces variabilis]KAJ3141252.1 hypothetical protein HDU90_007278 [Geranomyces variabilis]